MYSYCVAVDVRSLEEGRVEEVITSIWQGELQLVLVPEAEEDVEKGTAGCLMGLHEHQVGLWSAK